MRKYCPLLATWCQTCDRSLSFDHITKWVFNQFFQNQIHLKCERWSRPWTRAVALPLKQETPKHLQSVQNSEPEPTRDHSTTVLWFFNLLPVCFRTDLNLCWWLEGSSWPGPRTPPVSESLMYLCAACDLQAVKVACHDWAGPSAGSEVQHSF